MSTDPTIDDWFDADDEPADSDRPAGTDDWFDAEPDTDGTPERTTRRPFLRETTDGMVAFDQGRYDPRFEYGYVWGAANASWENVFDEDEVEDLPEDKWRLFENKRAGVSTVGRIYAALLMWHTLTTDQLSSMLDVPTKAVELHCSILANFGAISRGRMTSRLYVKPPQVWGIRSWPKAKQVLSVVVPDVNLAITAGNRPASQTVHAAYHNVYAAELAMRAAEQVPGVAVALGPHVSHYRGMGGSDEAAYADGSLVLDNGAIAAIEMITTSATQGPKRDRRLRALAARPGSETGLHVVYVGASRNDREFGQMLPRLRAEYEEASRRAYGRYTSDALQRVYYVNWIDWFPGTHRATDAFRRLTVTRLSDGAQIDLADLAKLDLPAFLRAPIGAAASLAAAVTPGSTVPVHYTNGAVIKPPAIAMAEWLSKHNDRRSPNGEYVGALNATKGNQRYLDKRADHATKKREKRLAKQAALAARRAAEAVA